MAMCLSVCHKSVFHRLSSVWTDRADFDMKAFFNLSYTVLSGNSVSTKIKVLPFETLSQNGLIKFRHGTSIVVMYVLPTYSTNVDAQRDKLDRRRSTNRQYLWPSLSTAQFWSSASRGFICDRWDLLFFNSCLRTHISWRLKCMYVDIPQCMYYGPREG